MAVEVKTGESFAAGTPRVLFQTTVRRITGPQYDVSPDGQRFLMNLSGEDPTLPITVVLDWPSGVAR